MTRYEIKNTTQFKKDYKLAKRRGLDIALLKEIVTKLANGELLDSKYKDHPLSGNWVGHRECHIQPDWLLIYRYGDDVLVLTLARTGTHYIEITYLPAISIMPCSRMYDFCSCYCIHPRFVA